MRKNAFASLWVALLLGSAARAQTPGTWGTWFIGTVQLPGDAGHKFGGFAEGQARTNGLFSQYFYNELKGGASYDIDDNFTVLVGGGRYATSVPHDLGAGPLSIEKRLWEQFTLTQHTKRLKLEHRYRIEQRLIGFRNDSTAFRQRIRCRLQAFLPLNRKTLRPGTVFLSAYDEIFLNPKGPVFERNRVYGGVGYQVNAHLTVQVGVVNQSNYTAPTFTQGQLVPQNTSAKNNLVVALSYKLAQRNAAGPVLETLPSQTD